MKSLSLKALWPLCLLLWLPFAAACEDNAGDTDTGEFTHQWQQRNAAYFTERMAEAKAAVAQAQATYGEDWQAHCEWRVFRSYAKLYEGAVKPTDSICCRIVERGTGTVSPLYTDSIRVNYVGRLIPTESYTAGRVFDHSGLYESDDYVFNPAFSVPTKLGVSNLVEGYTTAVQHMVVGDRWLVYIPQELGYQGTSSGVLPPYSTLTFDMQLKGIYRKGEVVGNW